MARPGAWGRKDFFLYLPFQNIHAPYDASWEHVQRFAGRGRAAPSYPSASPLFDGARPSSAPVPPPAAPAPTPTPLRAVAAWRRPHDASDQAVGRASHSSGSPASDPGVAALLLRNAALLHDAAIVSDPSPARYVKLLEQAAAEISAFTGGAGGGRGRRRLGGSPLGGSPLGGSPLGGSPEASQRGSASPSPEPVGGAPRGAGRSRSPSPPRGRGDGRASPSPLPSPLGSARPVAFALAATPGTLPTRRAPGLSPALAALRRLRARQPWSGGGGVVGQ